MYIYIYIHTYIYTYGVPRSMNGVVSKALKPWCLRYNLMIVYDDVSYFPNRGSWTS